MTARRLYALTDAQVAAAINCVDLDICIDDSLPPRVVSLYRRTIVALETPLLGKRRRATGARKARKR